MSVADALRHLVTLVEDTPVAEGPAWRPWDTGTGHRTALEGLHDTDDRVFDLGAPTVVDDGEVGCESTRVAMALDLRVRYRLSGSALERHARQAEDLRRLRDRLMYQPALYQAAVTGLQRVDVGIQTRQSIIPVGQTEPLHELLIIPLTMEVDP